MPDTPLSEPQKVKLILAPMATLSHEAFRRAVERFGGCDEYFTEMINAPSLLNRGPFEKYYLFNGPVPEKIVWQLTGNKSDAMAKAVKVVMEGGGIGVDLNMGCCAPQIANSGAGIAWMLKPLEETAAMVRGVKTALENEAKDGRSLRLSVKLRLGDEKYTDEGFFSFCDMLVEEGVQMLTLHARTKKEKYRGRPRWDYVEKLALRYEGRIPVILNGEIKDAESYRAGRMSAPHAAGVMVARAAAQKPWIFRELRGAESGKLGADGKERLEGRGPNQGEAATHSGTPVTSGTFTPDAPTPDAPTPATMGTSTPATSGTMGTLGTTPVASTPSTPTTPSPTSPIDLYTTALDFISDVQECQPPEFWKTRLQRFFAYYCQNFTFAHWAQTQMLNAKDIEDTKKRLEDIFQKCPQDRFLMV